MSPESASSLYPDRPILPLPKRRLRERLTPDIADSIKYPPAPQSSAPLFVYPYNSRDELVPIAPDLSATAASEAIPESRRELGTARLPSGYDESLMSHYRRSLASRPFQQQNNTNSPVLRTTPRQGHGRNSNPQPPSSTTSSADGYDSFENSNNKKKRKIPTAGESLSGGSHVLNDPSSFGVPSPPTTGDEGSGEFPIVGTAAPYYQTGGPLSATNPPGISGPGRGRYGRVRNGRSPLRTLPDPNSLWHGRPPADMKQQPGGSYPSPPTEKAGIISHAIATAERLPLPQGQGQENISLLHQQTSTKTSPTSTTHFNFTFDSQNPVSWPGSDPAHPGLSTSSHLQAPLLPSDYHNMRGARGTQTAMAPNGTAQGTVSGELGAHGTPQPRKPRRRGNSLLRIARQRKEDTMYKNYYHPPTDEEFWICGFCEYEGIFGRPPMALIQRYEMRERKRIHEDQERKRLMEKYKSKSRKGKKASKASSKNGPANPDRSQATSADPNAPPMHRDPSLGAQSEEYEEDEYYEDDIHSVGSPTNKSTAHISSPIASLDTLNSRPRRPGESIRDLGS